MKKQPFSSSTKINGAPPKMKKSGEGFAAQAKELSPVTLELGPLMNPNENPQHFRPLMRRGVMPLVNSVVLHCGDQSVLGFIAFHADRNYGQFPHKQDFNIASQLGVLGQGAAPPWAATATREDKCGNYPLARQVKAAAAKAFKQRMNERMHEKTYSAL